MDQNVGRRTGETEAHARLKRLAVLWAQANGYTACAVEVSLPQCRFRADVAAYRALSLTNGCTAIFECKQALADLRKDNCCATSVRDRLATSQRRRLTLEERLREHYPSLRGNESLFPEWDAYDFARIGHRGYVNLLREVATLQNRLRNGTKFEKLLKYRCANLFFLVLPVNLYRQSDVPIGWGALVEAEGKLLLRSRPRWQENSADSRHRLLHRIAGAGTRLLNRQMEITFDEILATRRSRRCT